jgi:flagellar hook protein FlgE
MSSFSIPLTGLKASSEALDTIANNLSNMNTTAFKSQNVTFSDLFYQQVGTTGSGNPLQVGAGTQTAATETDFSQGGIQETGNASDVYLNGNGFFVVQNGNTTEYTRAGNFTQGADGSLTTQGGQQVMGYPVVNGAVDTNAPLVPDRDSDERGRAAPGDHDALDDGEPGCVGASGDSRTGAGDDLRFAGRVPCRHDRFHE